MAQKEEKKNGVVLSFRCDEPVREIIHNYVNSFGTCAEGGKHLAELIEADRFGSEHPGIAKARTSVDELWAQIMKIVEGQMLDAAAQADAAERRRAEVEASRDGAFAEGEANVARIAELEREVAALRGDLAEKTSALSNANEANELMRKRVEGVDAREAAAERAVAAKEAAEAALAKAEGDARLTAKDLETANQRIESYKKALTNAEKALTNAEKERDEIREDRAALREENAALRAKVAAEADMVEACRSMLKAGE